MTEFVLSHKEGDPPIIYDMFAVCNHFGDLDGGHYTAFGYNVHMKKWYDFDDSDVSPVEKNEIQSKASYVLFYRRRK